MMDIIVDIDGSLADCTHRLHFIRGGDAKDWDAFFAACPDDKPIMPVIRMVRTLDLVQRVVFCSGRPERCRADTVVWLSQYFMGADAAPLYMRKDGDRRPDDVVKREMLQAMRADGFAPELVIDDRKRVVAMWRAEGLVCAQVAEGDF